MVKILELGAGDNPFPLADVTLDIRDLDNIDYPNIDISKEELPFKDNSFDKIVSFQVLEHIPPNRLTFVFNEVNRILKSKGKIHFEMPHSGTLNTFTDLTHFQGTTPMLDQSFDSNFNNAYWSNLNWDIKAYAVLNFPTFIRHKYRFRFKVNNGNFSTAICKIPFVNGKVVIKGVNYED